MTIFLARQKGNTIRSPLRSGSCKARITHYGYRMIRISHIFLFFARYFAYWDIWIFCWTDYSDAYRYHTYRATNSWWISSLSMRRPWKMTPDDECNRIRTGIMNLLRRRKSTHHRIFSSFYRYFSCTKISANRNFDRS